MKIRGKRIEPAEIEARLLEIEGVREAAVTLIEKDGEAQLYTHYVSDQSRTEKAFALIWHVCFQTIWYLSTGYGLAVCRSPETEK